MSRAARLASVALIGAACSSTDEDVTLDAAYGDAPPPDASHFDHDIADTSVYGDASAPPDALQVDATADAPSEASDASDDVDDAGD